MNSDTIARDIKSQLIQERNSIINHPLYAQITSLPALHKFMEHHVYAVWDFMSLLKSLQRNLTCVSHPWIPASNNQTSFLINEIVVGEESDVDQFGNRMSHFELYLNAMEECGANTQSIRTFIEALRNGATVEKAMEIAETPAAAKRFVNYTMSVVQSNEMHRVAAVFNFGREDLIPDMFMTMVEQLYSEYPDKVSTYKYYLERHIEVDGDHHSHLALEMTEQLCTSDKHWQDAIDSSKQCLIERALLWDACILK